MTKYTIMIKISIIGSENVYITQDPIYWCYPILE